MSWQGASVQREVVGTGVATGRHLGALHEEVVEQRGGAEAEPVGVEPVVAADLVDHHEVLDGVLGGLDAAGGLDADHLPGLVAEVADRLEHDQGDREGGCGLHLAGGGLDEVAARHHREPARAPDVVVGLQLTGLEDHLEVGAGAVGPGARLLDLGDLLVDVEVAPGEERAAVDDHVDLVGAGLDGVAGVGELDVHRRATTRERGGDRGHVDAAVAEGLLGRGDHVGVDADGGGGRTGRVGRVGAHRLRREGADLPVGVLALERGQVDHPDGQVDGEGLRGGLDRAGGQTGGAGLAPDLVDARKAVEESAERGVRAHDVVEDGVRGGRARRGARSGCHRPSIELARTPRAIRRGPMSAHVDEENMARLHDDREAVVERFRPTSGRFSGWAALLLSAVLVVAMVVYVDDGFPVWVGGVALLVGVLAWAAMLRPALWATDEHLVMRNLAETVHIRLAAVEELAVRQVLAVRAGDRRLVSTVLGRTWRKAMLSRGAPSSGDGPHEGMRYVDWAEHRLRELVDAARDRAGVAAGSEEQRALPGAVRREPATMPLALIAVAAVLMVVSFFL